MRRHRWAIGIVAAMALVAVGCGKSNDNPAVGGSQSTATTLGVPKFAAGTTMANLQAKGKIVVGTKFDQPGLGQKNPLTNQVEGFDVEIAKLVATAIFGGKPADLGNKIEFKEAVSANRETFLENGTVDIVAASYTITDARKQRVDFAGPYYVAAQDILVKADNTSIKTVNDLAGKTVCSVTNSTPAGRIRTMVPTAKLVEFATYTLCRDELLAGRADAVTTDDAILIGYASENPTALKVVGNKFSTEPYGIGIAPRGSDGTALAKDKGGKADDVFRNFVNDRLEEIARNGQWLAAFDATLGKSGVKAPQPPAVDRYGAAVVTTTSTSKP